MVNKNLPQKIESSFPALEDWTLRVAFPQTTSVNYKNAVRLAKLMDSYSEQIEPDGSLLHIVEFRPDELRRFKVLRGITANWKGCLFFICSELVDIEDLNFLECHSGKLMCKNYDKYCLTSLLWIDRTDSPFICKKMFDRRRYEKWYDIGIMDHEVFYVDKARIEEILIETAGPNRYCFLGPGLLSHGKLPLIQRPNARYLQKRLFGPWSVYKKTKAGSMEYIQRIPSGSYPGFKKLSGTE